MGLRINQNIMAINAHRNLVATNKSLARSLERLSSGLRINRAADDAAGLAISEKMRAQVHGLGQAMRNAEDGISLIGTAEGALNETHSILQRMRVLSVQAANDTLTSSDRVEIQREIDQLKSEIDRIANTTEFNTKKLLDGSTSALVSTDKLTTRVFMRDGLRVVDQFGQKAPGGGNYKLDITATAGQAEVQKTDLMMVKHGVLNEAVDQHLGYATFEASLAGTGSASDTFTFNFVVDGVSHNVTANAVTASLTSAAAQIRSAINTTAGLNDAISASGTGAELIIRRFDNPGEEFQVGWTITSEGGVTLQGVAAKDIHTIRPSDTNIQKLTFNANNLLVGNYELETLATADSAGSSATAAWYTPSGSTISGAITVTAGNTRNLSLQLEVASVDTGANTVTFSYSYYQMERDGSVTQGSGNMQLTGGSANASTTFGNVAFTAFTLTAVENYTVGDKILVNVAAEKTNAADDQVRFHKTDAVSSTITWNFSDTALNNATTTFNFYQLDTDATSSTYGQFKDVAMDMQFGVLRTENPAAGFTIRGGALGELADLDTKLFDIDRFWDSSGNFLLDSPKTISLVQGDGRTTSFTLFSTDTVQDVVDKLNAAIGTGLGQSEIVGSGFANNFVSYVTEPEASGLEAVKGTFVIRSAIAGKDGVLNFIGEEDLIKALSLTTIQNAQENQFSVTITEAHADTVVAENVQISGNLLIGAVHPNVDVEFATNSGIEVTWDAEEKSWSLVGGATNKTETFIHLADNTQVFHIGANPLQDVGAAIGDMRARAIGVHNVLVTTRDLANKAISQVDAAIGRVSTERSKMGALQNRLEHTISNLAVSRENLVAAEARIRDVDMAEEMMAFTRAQILLQAGTAMLAQANTIPQTVLQLLR